MKTEQNRVIKSEEIHFIRKTGKTIPGAGGRGADRRAETEADAKKLKTALREAYQNGRSDGIREGRELQKKENLQGIQTLVSLIRDVSALKRQMLETVEGQMLELVLAVAQKVIHMEVTTNRDVIRHVLKDAMKNIVDRENMKIRLHPQDFEYMMDVKADLLKSLDGVKNILFEQDASVAKGGALVETLFGEVDARLDQQYHEVKNAFLTAHDGR